MKVFIIIVTYNGKKWIYDCLKSIEQSTLKSEIVIVDNNSDDDTVSFIKRNYKDIILFEEHNNLGFGKANNIGISYALNNRADYVFLLNQDAFLNPSTLEDLIKVSKKYNDYGILSPVHLNHNGSLLDSSFDYYIRNFDCENLISDAILNKPKKEIYSIPMVNAAAWLLPKKTLKTVGGFDPIFFLYGEDDNYCQRIKFHNLKIGIVPTCTIRHDSNNNFKKKFKKGSENYFKKFEVRLKVKYADINQNNYSEMKKLRFFFMKECLLNFIKFNFIDSLINLKKVKIISNLDFKTSKQINRIKGYNYLLIKY